MVPHIKFSVHFLTWGYMQLYFFFLRNVSESNSSEDHYHLGYDKTVWQKCTSVSEEPAASIFSI
jgi:hypothetical protein